ncbi:hypothetical protein [Pedobacter sp. ASV28]|uniref:tetratricopeptide repeat protein n=1 Tax=Pedobacter sp. ASV28 TaxID=2795123 RepID=UPI0018EAFD00|nr:hypothetical protein [Pedobacter sp. ASV28]
MMPCPVRIVVFCLLFALTAKAGERQQPPLQSKRATQWCDSLTKQAATYYHKNSYQSALKSYLQALKIAEDHRLQKQRAFLLNNISALYIDLYQPKNLPNTQKGLQYAKQAVEALKALKTDSIEKRAALAVAYINYGDLLNSYGTDSKRPEFQQKAIAVFSEGIDFVKNTADYDTQANLYANLAYTYKNLNDKPKYFFYLQQAYRLTDQHPSAITLYVKQGVNFALGEYYSISGNISKALLHLHEAESLLKQEADPNYQMMNLVYGLANTIYQQTGNYKLAHQYQTRYWHIKDSLLNAETLRKFEEMEVRYQSERKGRQLKETALQLQNANLMRNALMAVAVLLCLSLFLFYRAYKNRHRALLLKQEVADMALQKAGVELAANRRLLERHTASLVEKNHLIDGLQQQLLQTGKADDKTLSKLANSRILTRQDWEEYKRLFDKVHPGFFIKLRSHFPDITDADERILAFSRLNISVKEAAALLGISYESMKNSRYRLRKKIGIQNDVDLKEVIGKM